MACSAPVVEGRDIVRFEFNSFSVVLQRAGKVTVCSERITSIVESFRVIWINSDGFRVIPYRSFYVATGTPCIGTAVQGGGILWVSPYCFLITGGWFVDF